MMIIIFWEMTPCGSYKNKIARLAKLLMERRFEGKCASTEEMQGEEDVNVSVEYSDIKSETDLKYELAEAISISTAKSQAGKVFLL
jgi:hypothetical protein